MHLRNVDPGFHTSMQASAVLADHLGRAIELVVNPKREAEQRPDVTANSSRARRDEAEVDNPEYWLNRVNDELATLSFDYRRSGGRADEALLDMEYAMGDVFRDYQEAWERSKSREATRRGQ